jgi:hypothetical protein
MRDYWLSKLFFDLQAPQVAAEFRANKDLVLEKYQLEDEVVAAIRGNDVTFLAARVNPYLLRYYFFTVGMKDAEFIQRLRDG